LYRTVLYKVSKNSDIKVEKIDVARKVDFPALGKPIRPRSESSLSCKFAHISSPTTVTIYAPMIYTAPCVRFLMWADRLHGEVGGLALEIESFVGPCEIARADRRVLFGAYKTRFNKFLAFFVFAFFTL
jgi:hypothetical protein